MEMHGSEFFVPFFLSSVFLFRCWWLIWHREIYCSSRDNNHSGEEKGRLSILTGSICNRVIDAWRGGMHPKEKNRLEEPLHSEKREPEIKKKRNKSKKENGGGNKWTKRIGDTRCSPALILDDRVLSSQGMAHGWCILHLQERGRAVVYRQGLLYVCMYAVLLQNWDTLHYPRWSS